MSGHLGSVALRHRVMWEASGVGWWEREKPGNGAWKGTREEEEDEKERGRIERERERGETHGRMSAECRVCCRSASHS